MSRWTERAGHMGPRKVAVVRPRDDFYPTPAPAVRALLAGGPLLGPPGLPAAVWEPACGDGAIARVLQAAGHVVVATDLNDHGYGTAGVDFLALARPPLDLGAIVTNPPFALADRFVAHALAMDVEVVALFLRLTYLEGRRRRALFLDRPPERVLVFANRVTLAPKGSGITTGSPTAYAWFVWRRGWRAAPQVDWVVAEAADANQETPGSVT